MLNKNKHILRALNNLKNLKKQPNQKGYNLLKNWFSKMVQYTKDISKMVQDMVLVFKCGLTVQNMKENGVKIKQMAKVNFGTQMVMFMKVSGKMIKQMVMEFMFILTELNMKDNGVMTYKTVQALNPGAMEVNMKEVIKKE
jgi:hypothetical protein